MQERVVAEVDARDDVAGVERDLLSLGEEAGGVAVEGHLADTPDRDELLRDELGGIEDVEVEVVDLVLLDDLDAELELGEVPAFDRLPQVATVEVRVLAGDLLGLVPDEGVGAEDRLPVPLDEAGATLLLHQTERVDAEAPIIR
jgi:hypothetical protein